MKKCSYVRIGVIFLCLFLLFPLVVAYAEESMKLDEFPDAPLLQTYIERGIIEGDEHGNISLDRNVTRAEWLVMLKRVLDIKKVFMLKPSIPDRTFADLEGHWAEETIRFWIEHGIIQGDEKGNLRLDEPITFAEMIVTLDRIINHHKQQKDEHLEHFRNHWAYSAANHLYQLDWIQFDEPLWHEVIDLDRYALRGEVLLLLAPFYFYKDQNEHRVDISNIDKPVDTPFDVNQDGIIDFSFRLSSSEYELEMQSVTEEVYNYIKQKDWTYHVEKNSEVIGELYFQLQQIKEKDIAFFIRYFPVKEDDENFVLELLYYGKSTLKGRTPVSEIGEEKLPYDWQEVVLDTEMTLPYSGLLLSADQVDLRVSATDTYREMGYTVRDYAPNAQETSFGTQHSQGYQFTFTFTNKVNYVSETWGLLAPTGLYDWDNKAFTNFMLRDDISINKRLSYDGLYFRTPYNYVPRTSMSYYLNPANIVGVRAIPMIRENKGRFVEDFALMLAYMSVRQQTKQGIWPTQPKSEWLEKDYGIRYQYFDNRRNADNATFLLMVYQKYPDETFYSALEKHMQTLYKLIGNHSIHTSEQGILFSDYIGDVNSKMSHVALNHHLAVINLLLQWYGETSDEQAKTFAERMIIGIEDTVNLWMKPNGDLYYALYEDLSPHPYPDYIDLTLQDLRQTQNLIFKHFGSINESIQTLINTKSSWLESKIYN